MRPTWRTRPSTASRRRARSTSGRRSSSSAIAPSAVGCVRRRRSRRARSSSRMIPRRQRVVVDDQHRRPVRVSSRRRASCAQVSSDAEPGGDQPDRRADGEQFAGERQLVDLERARIASVAAIFGTTCVLREREHRRSRRAAPSTPAIMPSAMNGMRMYMLVAPTSCMIAISRRRAKTVRRIVLAMMIAAESDEQRDQRDARRGRAPSAVLQQLRDGVGGVVGLRDARHPWRSTRATAGTLVGVLAPARGTCWAAGSR